LWRGRLRVFLTGSKYPSVSFAVGLIPFGLVVAAVVTPPALSLSKRPSDDGCYENGKAWILERGWVANASELAPGIFTGFRQTQKKARRKWRAEGE
jgi:hypothetical protein